MEAPDLSSQVHTHDLTGTPSPDGVAWGVSTFERFRHRHWQSLRESTYTVLKSSGASDSTLARFAACGSYAHAWHSPSTKRLVICASTCHSRWCEPCSRARKSKIASNLRREVEGKHLRLTTLTLAHHNAPLPDLLTRLHASFKLFRRRRDWQEHVTGFAAFVHVKWSDRSNWWHVHLHIVSEGTWWDHRELSKAWHASTGDSFIADIREVSNEEGVNYAARYAAQPVRLGDVPPNRRIELFAALHHRRLWQVGGSWKGFDLLSTEPLPPDLVHVDSLDRIVARAAQGDLVARDVLVAIAGDAVDWITAEEIGAPPNPFDTT